MWWNFAGRSQEEVVQAREDWMKGTRFGEVKGYDGDPLRAPELPQVPLEPRAASAARIPACPTRTAGNRRQGSPAFDAAGSSANRAAPGPVRPGVGPMAR